MTINIKDPSNAVKDTLYLTKDIQERVQSELALHTDKHGMKSHWARVGLNLVLDALQGKTDSMQSRLMRLTGQVWKVEVTK